MGLFNGKDRFLYAPCLLLQQLCRFSHSAEEVGFHYLSRGHKRFFFFFQLQALQLNNKKLSWACMSHNFIHIFAGKLQASDGKLTAIMASS